jgi:hypothetical protein
VSLESRYATCLFLPFDTSTSAMMTLPRAESDLLMLPASFKRSPPAFVELYVAWHSEQGNGVSFTLNYSCTIH